MTTPTPIPTLSTDSNSVPALKADSTGSGPDTSVDMPQDGHESFSGLDRPCFGFSSGCTGCTSCSSFYVTNHETGDSIYIQGIGEAHDDDVEMEEMLSAMIDRLGPEGAADPSLLEAAMELAHKQLERRVSAQKAAASITKTAKKAAETENKGNVAVTATATDAAGDAAKAIEESK